MAVHLPDEVIPEASYVIRQCGSLIKAFPAPRSGYKSISGTDVTTVVNAAMNALTSGRTHKEVVAVKGNFTVSTKIQVPSYTILDLRQAKLTLANSANINMIENSDTSGGNTQLEIIGGMIDGNRANQTADLSVIFLQKVTRGRVIGSSVTGARRAATIRGEGIELYQSTYCIVTNCHVYDNDYDGIKVRHQSHHNLIIGNVCENNGSCGVQLAFETGTDIPQFIAVVGNMIYAYYGGPFIERGIALHKATDSLVIGNFIDAHASWGIHLIEGSLRNLIKGNYIENSAVGVTMDTASNNRNAIIGNYFETFATGINVGAYGDENLINDNYFNYGTTGITLSSGSDNNHIKNNYFRGVTTAISDAGANNIIDHYIKTGLTHAVVGTLSVGTDKAPTLLAMASMKILKVKLVVKTAPTGADLICDINKNGTTIFTTQANRPKITAGSTTGDSGVPDVASLAEGDKLTLDIDQVGSTVAGADLTAQIVALYNAPY